MKPNHVRLDLFDPTKGLNRGRHRLIETTWYLLKCTFFLSPLPWPNALKVGILRAFGASIGIGSVIKPRVNIHFPWKLTIGDHVWIGEETFLLNFEPITIGDHVCLSQRSFLCTGNHDFRAPDFKYRNRPINVGNGAWIGAQVFVGPGVTIEAEAVAAAGAIVLHDCPANTIIKGNPAAPTGKRFPQEQ